MKTTSLIYQFRQLKNNLHNTPHYFSTYLLAGLGHKQLDLGHEAGDKQQH